VGIFKVGVRRSTAPNLPVTIHPRPRFPVEGYIWTHPGFIGRGADDDQDYYLGVRARVCLSPTARSILVDPRYCVRTGRLIYPWSSRLLGPSNVGFLRFGVITATALYGGRVYEGGLGRRTVCTSTNNLSVGNNISNTNINQWSTTRP